MASSFLEVASAGGVAAAFTSICLCQLRKEKTPAVGDGTSKCEGVSLTVILAEPQESTITEERAERRQTCADYGVRVAKEAASTTKTLVECMTSEQAASGQAGASESRHERMC